MTVCLKDQKNKIKKIHDCEQSPESYELVEYF